MYSKSVPSVDKPVYDLGSELYDLTSRLVVRSEEVREQGQPTRLVMKTYVQWSKNNLQPLDDAIECLAVRVRETTKAGENVYTRTEHRELSDQIEAYQRAQREQTADGTRGED